MRVAVDVLVGDRLGVPQDAERGRDLQLARVVDAEAVGAAVRESDVRRRGAGMDVELVLQDAGLPAQAQVDAGPEIAIDDVAVLREARLPLARITAAQVVDDAGGTLGALRHGLWILVDELEGEGDLLGGLRRWLRLRRGRARLLLRERQHHGARRHEEPVAAALRVEAGARVGLAAVLGERDGEVRVGPGRLLLAHRGRRPGRRRRHPLHRVGLVRRPERHRDRCQPETDCGREHEHSAPHHRLSPRSRPRPVPG